MAKLSDIIQKFEDFAPVSLAEDWDNVGLLLGHSDKEIKKVLLALDLDLEIVNQAISEKADLIFTHHPIIMGGIKNITDATLLGRNLIYLIKHDISVYSAHTNFDFADGGICDKLASKAGIHHIKKFSLEGEKNCGRMGEVTKTTFGEYIDFIKNALSIQNIRYAGDLNKTITKVGVCCGGGADFAVDAAKNGCDAFVSGDFKYHSTQNALNHGICIIDAGHFETEIIMCDIVKSFFKRNFNDIQVIMPNVKESYIKYR